ncbi:MAG: SAF domain-containing protein, partial [Nocardioides sp.]
RDLPSGAVLTGGDLRTVGFAPDTVPEGTVPDIVGRTLAAPLRTGEPVTDLRLVGPALTEGYPGLAAVPVRLPDAGVAGLLAVGDRIDLVAADPEGGSTEVVAADAPVLALPSDQDDPGVTGLGGRLVVVGVQAIDVIQIADASVRAYLTVAYSD